MLHIPTRQTLSYYMIQTKAIIILLIMLSGFINPLQASAAKQYTIAVIPKATLMHYWKIVCVGAHAAIRDSNATIIWRGPRVENKLSAQQYLVKFYADKKVDAIVIAPTHKDKLNESIKNAVSAGIKVVIIDSLVTGGNAHCSIATDNYKAGRLGAELLLDRIKKKGPILLMGNTPDSSSISRREQGFIDTLNELSPGRTVIRVNILEGTRKESELAARDILTTTPSIAGIFAVNEVSSEGVLRILDKKKISGKTFIGFDFSQKLLAGLESGKIDALITQKPFALGYTGVRTALELLKGQKVVRKMESPVKVITKENYHFTKHLRCLRDFTEEEKKECPMCFN